MNYISSELQCKIEEVIIYSSDPKLIISHQTTDHQYKIIHHRPNNH